MDSCPTCGQPRATRYCGTCGERRVEPDELGFRRFLHALGEELVPAFDAGDADPLKRMGGRVFRTVYTLFRYPGRLTADYIAGRRRPYLKPVQVFLTVSLLFFLFGHNYFQFKLDQYGFVPGIGRTASLVEPEQRRLNLTADIYETRFNERLAAHKKAVMALTVPLFALGIMPLFRRRKYGEHLVFSIHFFALLLLFMVTVMYAVFQSLLLLMRGLDQDAPAAAAAIGRALDTEWLLVLMVYGPMLFYLALAVHRVYGGTRLVSAWKALVLVLWHIAMLTVVFRYALFFTTFYSMKWFE